MTEPMGRGFADDELYDSFFDGIHPATLAGVAASVKSSL